MKKWGFILKIRSYFIFNIYKYLVINVMEYSCIRHSTWNSMKYSSVEFNLASHWYFDNWFSMRECRVPQRSASLWITGTLMQPDGYVIGLKFKRARCGANEGVITQRTVVYSWIHEVRVHALNYARFVHVPEQTIIPLSDNLMKLLPVKLFSSRGC